MATKGRTSNEIKPTKAKFRYIFSDDYNPVYANGAYGGITPRGEIAVNFYLERHGLPYEEVHKLTDEGQVDELISKQPQESEDTVKIVRFISAGVVLSLESAIRIRDWLSSKISDLEKLKKAKNGE